MAKKRNIRPVPLRKPKNPIEIHPIFIKMCELNHGVRTWSSIQKNLFMQMVSRLDWDDCEQGHMVRFKNTDIMKIIGLKVPIGLTAGEAIRKEFEYMKSHSTFPVAIEPWFQMNVLHNQDLIENISGDDEYTIVTINYIFLNYFTNPFGTGEDIRYHGPEKPDWS
jgi:hypothetical protein